MIDNNTTYGKITGMKKSVFTKLKPKARVIGLVLVLAYIVYCIGFVMGEHDARLQKTSTVASAPSVTHITPLEIYELVNQERIRSGLSPLDYRQTLQRSAQDKCNDMATKGYWSHETPDGKGPETFVQAQGQKYYSTGENLANGFNSSATTVTGWMNSPSHKENILRSEYKETGIAVCEAKNFQGKATTHIVVQHFTAPPK